MHVQGIGRGELCIRFMWLRVWTGRGILWRR